MSTSLILRPTTEADLDILCAFEADEPSAQMAAFVHENWKDKNAGIERWKANLNNPGTRNYTIISDGEIVGNVLSYILFGETQVSYWIARAYWNKGIATRALKEFMTLVPERPLYGRVAFDNIRSAKVLLKCGFRKIGVDTYRSNIRGAEIEEVIYQLH